MSPLLKLSRFILIYAFLLPLHFAQAAERSIEGKDIFQQRCAKCHGRDGQGVKGKYNDPLEGNLSLSGLTRYIEKNMPDDDPGTCKGKEAQAVARHVYDSFYSRQARTQSIQRKSIWSG